MRQRPRSSSKHVEDDAASESDGEDTGFNKSEVEEQHEDLGTCRTCGRSCASLRRLKAHKETGHDGATVLCRKCSQAYKTAFNRKKHEALCGADTARSTACGLRKVFKDEPKVEDEEGEAEVEGQVKRVDVRMKRLHRSVLQNDGQYLGRASRASTSGEGEGKSQVPGRLLEQRQTPPGEMGHGYTGREA